MYVIHKFCAVHTPLKSRILAKFSSALPINIVIIRQYCELGMKVLLNQNWTLSILIASCLENKYKTSSNSECFLYMHLISVSCVVVLVIDSIFHVIFALLPKSDITYWIKYFDKIKCYSDRPYLVFFQPETWNTHIYFFCLMCSKDV